jgi:hypothetical protein
MFPGNGAPATALENSLDDTKQCATLLGLQVQSVVTRVHFPHEGTRGLYRTLGEQSKNLSSSCKTISLSCVPNSTEWLSSIRCFMYVKINNKCYKNNNNAIK